MISIVIYCIFFEFFKKKKKMNLCSLSLIIIEIIEDLLKVFILIQVQYSKFVLYMCLFYILLFFGVFFDLVIFMQKKEVKLLSLKKIVKR